MSSMILSSDKYLNFGAESYISSNSIITNNLNPNESIIQQKERINSLNKKTMSKVYSQQSSRLTVPKRHSVGQNRSESNISEDEEQLSVNSRRLLDKNSGQNYANNLLPDTLRNINDQEDLNIAHLNNRRFSKSIHSKFKPSDQLSYAEQLQIDKINHTLTLERIEREEKNSMSDHSMAKASESRHSMVINKEIKTSNKITPEIKENAGINQQQKRVSQKMLGQIPLQQSNNKEQTQIQSDRSQVMKEKMKILVKSYLNRSQTEIEIGIQDQDKKLESTQKKLQITPSMQQKESLPNFPKVESINEQELFEYEDPDEILKKINDKKKYRCLLRVNGNKRIRWDLFVLVLSIWNCYTLPLDAAFQPEIFQAWYFQVFNNLIDCCFGLDIILNFRTTFLNRQTGDEITNSKQIAIQYLSGKFWIDLLATIPFDQILNQIIEGSIADKFQLLSMLKLLRVLRLSKIITYMNATDEVKLSLKLCKMMFFLIMYLHCQACAWFYFVQIEQQWIPPAYIVFNKRTQDFYQQDFASQYSVSFYTSLLILYGGDQTPVNNYQMLLLAFFFIIAAMINANILGTIAMIIQTMNRRASRFQEQIDIANTAMKNMKLPEELQKKVQEFMMYTQTNLDQQKELDMFLNMISPSLRLQVTQHIFLNAISKNAILKGNQELIRFVVHNIITLLYLPEDTIIRQGQKAHNMFFLSQGACEVWIRDQHKRDTFVRNLTQGTLFGEVALIAQSKRTASVKSKNYCTLAALSEDSFYEMCQYFPDIFFKIKQDTKKYNDKWKTFQLKLISSIEYFAPLSDDIKEEIYYKLSMEYFEQGNDIFTSGEQCKALYFIVNGEIDLLIQQKDDEEEILLDTLYTGCSIGAYSLIKEIKYPYTAKARNNVTLLVLTKVDLMETVEFVEQLHQALWDAEEFIDSNGVPLCDYTIYRPLWRQSENEALPIQKFKNAVRRIKILNQRNKKKRVKIMELLSLLQEAQTMNKATPPQKKISNKLLQQKSSKSSYSLSPFVKRHFINQIKNKTADHPSFSHDHSYEDSALRANQNMIKMLTFKIENLSNHIQKQNLEMRNLQKIIKSKGSSQQAISNSSVDMRTDDEIKTENNLSDNQEEKIRKQIKKGNNRSKIQSPTLRQQTQRFVKNDNVSLSVEKQLQTQKTKQHLLPVKLSKFSPRVRNNKELIRANTKTEAQTKFQMMRMLSIKKSSNNQNSTPSARFLSPRNPAEISFRPSNRPRNEEGIAKSQDFQRQESQSKRLLQNDYNQIDIFEGTGATNVNFNHFDSLDSSTSIKDKKNQLKEKSNAQKDSLMSMNPLNRDTHEQYKINEVMATDDQDLEQDIYTERQLLKSTEQLPTKHSRNQSETAASSSEKKLLSLTSQLPSGPLRKNTQMHQHQRNPSQQTDFSGNSQATNHDFIDDNNLHSHLQSQVAKAIQNQLQQIKLEVPKPKLNVQIPMKSSFLSQKTQSDSSPSKINKSKNSEDYRRMTTAEINQMIEEEVRNMFEKKKIRRVSKDQIQPIQEESESYDERKLLDHITEEDDDYEYYYDEE